MGSGKMQQQLQKVDKIIFQEAEGISVSFVLVLITPLHFFFLLKIWIICKLQYIQVFKILSIKHYTCEVFKKTALLLISRKTKRKKKSNYRA